MDQYELQERQITQSLNKYRKNRTRQLYKKIINDLDLYYLFLDENLAPDEKYQWHKQQKQFLNELKRQKDDIVTQNISQNGRNVNDRAFGGQNEENMGLQFTKKLEQEISKQLNRVQAGTEKAIQISTFIKVELNRQIQKLDEIYDENVDMSHRLDRAKKGLLVILRRAMLNKLTRCLVILLVLAIIALIVLYILKGQNVI